MAFLTRHSGIQRNWPPETPVEAAWVDPDGAVIMLSRNVLDLQVELPRLAKAASISLRRMEPLDDSLESVFG